MLPPDDFGVVVLVPGWGGLFVGACNWKDGPAGAIKADELLGAAIAHALADSDQSVVVISDQNLVRQSERMIQIAPESTPQNIGIVRLAASIFPRPQVMVRIRNQSARQSCELTVRSGEQT